MSATHSLASIIQVYQKHNLPRLEAHLSSYSRLDPAEAILHAALAERFNETKQRWNRHDHQRRLRRFALQACLANLKEVSFAECESFHELFLKVERAIGKISGIGELMVYDTSLRIGANVGLQPDRVYLHSGTRKGSARLGLQTDGGWLFLAELPEDFRSLTPCQVEDMLCIYKDKLSPDSLR